MNLEAMYPPESSNFVGGGDFRQIGEALCSMIREYAGLGSDERILDVGCGIGRVAIPLTQILSENGTYDGLDIVPSAIEWCQRKITPMYPNFKFHLADVKNNFYYKAAKHNANNYKFPFKDNSFDLVILTSVFTHMLGTPMENYLSQLSRVLDVGGRTFITYYLRTEEANRGIEDGLSSWNFTTFRDSCWIADSAKPEMAVCYDISRIEMLYEKYGFEIEKRVLADWFNVKGSGAQDILVGRKVRNVAVSNLGSERLLNGIKRILKMSRRF